MIKVKLKITSVSTEASCEVNSLLNTGYGSEEPEVVLPIGVAEKLGFWPKVPESAVVEAYEAAGGSKLTMHYLANAIKIQAITEDKKSKVVKCALAISELEREVLLSDQAIDELEIVIESPGRGLWRFRDEVKVRGSAEPQYW